MTDDEQESPAITAATVPDNLRLDFLPKHFGKGMMVFEQAVYNCMGHLCADYKGGSWAFRTLSNGGAYIAPDSERKFKLQSTNGWSGELSADAAGIAVTLFALSHLSFQFPHYAELFSERYHQLRDYAFEDHPEARSIIEMCD